MKLKTIFIVLLLVVMTTSCGRRVTLFDLSPEKTIENEYISFKPPSVFNWYSYRNDNWIVSKDKNKNKIGGTFNLRSKVNGGSYHIRINTSRIKKNFFSSSLSFFDKDKNFDIRKYDEITFSEIEKEQGVNYRKQWGVFIAGLKCGAGVYSRGGSGVYKKLNIKNYRYVCAYYDKKEGKSLLQIRFKPMYSIRKAQRQTDSGLPQEMLLRVNKIEQGMKLSIEQLVNSLKIKNMDVNKMKDEGLLFLDRQYESSPY